MRQLLAVGVGLAAILAVFRIVWHAGTQILCWGGLGPHGAQILPVFLFALITSHLSGGYGFARIARGRTSLGLLVAYFSLFAYRGWLEKMWGLPLSWLGGVVIIGGPLILAGSALGNWLDASPACEEPESHDSSPEMDRQAD